MAIEVVGGVQILGKCHDVIKKFSLYKKKVSARRHKNKKGVGFGEQSLLIADKPFRYSSVNHTLE